MTAPRDALVVIAIVVTIVAPTVGPRIAGVATFRPITPALVAIGLPTMTATAIVIVTATTNLDAPRISAPSCVTLACSRPNAGCTAFTNCHTPTGDGAGALTNLDVAVGIPVDDSASTTGGAGTLSSSSTGNRTNALGSAPAFNRTSDGGTCEHQRQSKSGCE